MSEFFVHYPQISYNITGKMPPVTKKVINIMERAKIRSVALDDIVAYYPYSIPEGERPDMTAYKYYGDVKYTWLIFFINNIQDPIYDWPLGSREFTDFIKHKYGSIGVAKNKIHHYEQIVRERIEATGTTDAIPRAYLEVDETTYNSLNDSDRDIVYCYNWEVDHNEEKRDIKMVDKKYASEILSELAGKFK